MKRFIKIMLSLLLTLAAVGIGLGLPVGVSEYEDKKLDGTGETLDSLGMSLGMREREHVSIEDKLRLLAEGEIYTVETAAAEYMDAKAAIKETAELLKVCEKIGVPQVSIDSTIREKDAIPVLFTDKSGSGISFFAWRVLLQDYSGSSTFIIDDETGIPLALFHDEDVEDTDVMTSEMTSEIINPHIALEYFCDRVGCVLMEIEELYVMDNYSNQMAVVSFDGGKTTLELPIIGTIHTYSFNFESVGLKSIIQPGSQYAGSQYD